ncbi:polysaccharide export protein [Halioglobus maricola]|uniref:Polysaccharide export protein n=2 Tax=Halioglobus maricola TaxID=2601894 RepID=A0A5P9NPC1_9GAMM|nr:polysaccharide export protein [Halioglobus maricola]
MKIALTTLFMFAVSVLSGGPMALAQDAYKLSSGDTISIHVYGEPDLTFDSVLIGQNGRISYPFLGELKVAGQSTAELEQRIESNLQPDYLIDPRVSVSMVKYRLFFVNGEVKNPGGVDFQPGLTLRKAVSLAGGFTERANRKKVLLIQEADPNREEQEVGLDYKIQPGDIITVQDTFF